MFEDSRRTALEKYLQKAIEKGLTHRLACMVICGKDRFEFHAGESTPDTEYDLASLTKILCTTLLTAQAVSEGLLQLDEKPWPNWPGVTVEQVLTHTAGLPPWVDVTSIDDVLKIKPIGLPGKKTIYSDMGFIALGHLLEQRLKEPLDELFQMPHLHFKGPQPVDDPRCRALGGVAGHAGLFGTLNGVVEASLYFLMALKDPQTPVQQVIRQFAMHKGKRAIGFDKATKEGSTGGVLSKKTVGHLGYTGTSVWIDPVNDAVYILLMRRLDNGSRADEILEFRRGFHQLAAKMVKEAA